MNGTPLKSPGQRTALTASRRAMVALLADMVITETDTPGAIQAGVPEFIDDVVSYWYTPAERRIFLDGLAELDADCLKRFGDLFSACTPEQRTEALSDSEARSIAFRNAQGNPVQGIQDEPDPASPFFYKLKELTVPGYYTSEVGATTELNYNPVPGHFDGDVGFKAVGGRQWST